MAERAGLSCGCEVLALILSFFQGRKEGRNWLVGRGEWRDRYVNFGEKGGERKRETRGECAELKARAGVNVPRKEGDRTGSGRES